MAFTERNNPAIVTGEVIESVAVCNADTGALVVTSPVTGVQLPPIGGNSPTSLRNEVSSWAASAWELLISNSRSPETQRAYRRDLADFFSFGCPAITNNAEATRWLCDRDSASLAMVLNGYRANLRERKLSPATINRRLAAVRSLLNMARRLFPSCPDPKGLVDSEKTKAYRDTRGPQLSAAARILASVDRSTVQGKRDYALFLLFLENGLRRGEIVRANVGDFDAGGKALQILGKGRGSEKDRITLSTETVDALSVYLVARSSAGEVLAAGSPLLATVGRGTRASDNRLGGSGLAYVVAAYGRRVLGVPDLHCHALRHTAITSLLDATNGDIRTAQRLSRHKDIRTLSIYDDNRSDMQGRATNLLSDLLKSQQGKGKV